MPVPPLDRVDLRPEIAPGPMSAFADRKRYPELAELRLEHRIEAARHRSLPGAGAPCPLAERSLGVNEIPERDHGHGRTRLGRELLRLPDPFGEELRVDRAAVDVLEGDPRSREEPVELDDPADEIRVGLLPEGLPALPKELVDERRDAVRERVGVEEGVVEGVPLPGPPPRPIST